MRSITPARSFRPPRNDAGLYAIVSGGLGTSVVPVRVGVPPEIVHIQIGVQSMIRKRGGRLSEQIMFHKGTAKKNDADRVGAWSLSASETRMSQFAV